MTEPSDIRFDFVGETDLYVIVTFSFVSKDSNERISFGELEKFREELKSKEVDNPIKIDDIGYDERKTGYSLSKYFCEESDYESKQNLPFIFPIEPKILSSGVSADEAEFNETKENNQAKIPLPEDLEIKVTNYGVASVKFHYNILKKNSGLEDYINEHRKIRNECRDEYAEEVWGEFTNIWNSLAERRTRKPDRIDYYTVGVSQGIDIKKGENTIPIVYLNESDETWVDKLGTNKKGLQIIKRKLVGVNRLSERWSEYDNNIIEEELDQDISQTLNEFQFVNWKKAFILRDDRSQTTTDDKGESPSPYSDYFDDMLLGLELLVMIRSSLQLLESFIDEESDGFFENNSKKIRLLDVRRLQRYYSQIEMFDEWLMSIKHWRRIQRYTVITHYHDFINESLLIMRIDAWLNTNDEKLDHIRETHRTRSKKLESINQVILTIILVVLTALLALPAIQQVF